MNKQIALRQALVSSGYEELYGEEVINHMVEDIMKKYSGIHLEAIIHGYNERREND